LQVFVGLEGSAKELGIGAHNTWAFSSADLEGDLERYFALNPTPETLSATDVPLIFVSFPSAKDPDWAARFPGRSTCEVVTVAPWQWFEGDAAKKPGKRGLEYEAIKAAISQRIWKQVQALFPSLAGRNPVHLSAGSPATNAFYYRSQKGVMYGADHNLHRFTAGAATALRPGSALAGLYLTGQDVFMCGFAGALFGGLLCASEVLGRNLYFDLLRLKARSPPPDFAYGTVNKPIQLQR
jgi:all-trans-retinol 13,14-reductase